MKGATKPFDDLDQILRILLDDAAGFLRAGGRLPFLLVFAGGRWVGGFHGQMFSVGLGKSVDLDQRRVGEGRIFSPRRLSIYRFWSVGPSPPEKRRPGISNLGSLLLDFCVARRAAAPRISP